MKRIKNTRGGAFGTALVVLLSAAAEMADGTLGIDGSLLVNASEEVEAMLATEVHRVAA